MAPHVASISLSPRNRTILDGSLPPSSSSSAQLSLPPSTLLRPPPALQTSLPRPSRQLDRKVHGIHLKVSLQQHVLRRTQKKRRTRTQLAPKQEAPEGMDQVGGARSVKSIVPSPNRGSSCHRFKDSMDSFRCIPHLCIAQKASKPNFCHRPTPGQVRHAQHAGFAASLQCARPAQTGKNFSSKDRNSVSRTLSEIALASPRKKRTAENVVG